MYYRSWLLAPADSEKRLMRAAESGADIVVVDLEGTVATLGREQARGLAAEWLAAHRHTVIDNRRLGRWVRINPLDSRMWRDDLVAVLKSVPDGIILPRAAGPEAVRHLAAELYELEQHGHIPGGSIKIMPIVNETARAAISIADYLEAPHQRLAGMTWNAETMAASINASRNRDARGGWTDAFRFVRAQTLLTANALGLLAVDTFRASPADDKILKAAARLSHADGFIGMLASQPSQVPVINAAFTPSAEAMDDAREIIAAFESERRNGVTSIDRRIIAPGQLEAAKRLLGIDEEPVQAERRMPVLRPA